MSKWYARTCGVNSDGKIHNEILAPTAHILSERVRAEPPNHWTIFLNGRYKETWTTLWDFPGELFCTHNEFSKPNAPLIPKEELE